MPNADTLVKILAQYAERDAILGARIAALAMFVAAIPGASEVPLDALKQSIANEPSDSSDALRTAMKDELDCIGRIVALATAHQSAFAKQ